MASEEFVEYIRLPESLCRCTFENCLVTNPLFGIPIKKRAEVLQRYRLFISKQIRVCAVHRINDDWNSCKDYALKRFSTRQLKEMKELQEKYVKKTNGTLSSKTVTTIEVMVTVEECGLSNSDFLELFEHLPTLETTIKGQKGKIALKMYLARLRTGDSLKRLCRQFNLSQMTQQKYINAARDALLKDFVPANLGFDCFDRATLIQNTSQMAKILYGAEKVILVADATYIYINKSGNFKLQRITYNDQKKRNFIKPMIFVTTNGTFVDIFGAYKATQNDAKIMIDVFRTEGTKIMEKLKENDVFLVDRGFRDCVQMLKEKKFDVKMPELIQNDAVGRKTGQLTTKKGNRTRTVTACRFVVEARNGHLKSVWKIFSRVLSTYEIKHLMKDIRIGAALINRFRVNIESNLDDAEIIGNSMMDRVELKNDFAKIVNSKTYKSKIKTCIEIDSQAALFPVISLEDIKKITLGTYQIGLARSYLVEHLKRNRNSFEIFEFPQNENNVFRDTPHFQKKVYITRMFSRFRKNKRYNVHVSFDPDKNGPDAILGFVCDCKHGLRVVRTCSHVVAFIYYMSHYRWMDGSISEIAASIRSEVFPSDSD